MFFSAIIHLSDLTISQNVSNSQTYLHFAKSYPKYSPVSFLFLRFYNHVSGGKWPLCNGCLMKKKQLGKSLIASLPTRNNNQRAHANFLTSHPPPFPCTTAGSKRKAFNFTQKPTQPKQWNHPILNGSGCVCEKAELKRKKKRWSMLLRLIMKQEEKSSQWYFKK